MFFPAGASLFSGIRHYLLCPSCSCLSRLYRGTKGGVARHDSINVNPAFHSGAQYTRCHLIVIVPPAGPLTHCTSNTATDIDRMS